MHLDIRQLRYFIAVAKYLSFTEAANQLYVAQSAISQQIADLEEKMGVKLFKRSKRSVELTPAGAVFLKEAEEIVEKMAEAVDKARQTENGIIGSLNIGFLSVHVKDFLPGIIKAFRARYPKVELNLNHYPSQMIKEGLEKNDLDIGFAIPSGLHRIEGIQIRTVHRSPYCAVMHRNHPLAHRSSIHMAELSHEPFVIHNRHDSPVGSYDHIVRLCQQSGFAPHVVSHPRFVDSVLVLVESEIGIGVLPSDFEAYASPQIRFVPIEGVEDNHFELAIAWKETNMNPSVALFLDLFQEFIPFQ